MLKVAALLAVVAGVVTACQIVPTQAGFKPLLVGLIDKGNAAPFQAGQPFPVIDLSNEVASSPGLAGVVVNVSWSQLEPTQGTFDFSTLDASLSAVQTYNDQYPSAQLGVRLRVFGADDAPAWAKTLDGTPISITANGGSQGTDGQWWQPDYRVAWAALQQALAQRYDNNPLVREVVVASCASLTDEPFVMATTSSDKTQMLADGWTDAAQQACLDGALSDYAPWQHTALYYPFNPFTTISTAGTVGTDDSVTDEVMQRCASSVSSGGPWCILGNNAVSSPATQPAGSLAVYSEMDTLWGADQTGTPISFQMNSPTASVQCAALDVAVSHHALSVELWPLGITGESASTLSTWNTDLTLGVQPTC
jgi:Beta-galactosidase